MSEKQVPLALSDIARREEARELDKAAFEFGAWQWGRPERLHVLCAVPPSMAEAAAQALDPVTSSLPFPLEVSFMPGAQEAREAVANVDAVMTAMVFGERDPADPGEVVVDLAYGFHKPAVMVSGNGDCECQPALWHGYSAPFVPKDLFSYMWIRKGTPVVSVRTMPAWYANGLGYDYPHNLDSEWRPWEIGLNALLYQWIGLRTGVYAIQAGGGLRFAVPFPEQAEDDPLPLLEARRGYMAYWSGCCRDAEDIGVRWSWEFDGTGPDESRKKRWLKKDPLSRAVAELLIPRTT